MTEEHEVNKSSKKLIPTLKLFVELSAVIAIFGFSASAILNDFVFKKWGLSFVQAASISDIIMSGSNFAFSVLPTLLISIAISFITYFGAGKLTSIEFSEHEKTKSKIENAFGFIIALFIIAMLGIPVYEIFVYKSIGIVALIFGVSAFLFSLRIFYIEVFSNPTPLSNLSDFILSWIIFFASFFIGFLTIYVWFNGKIETYSSYGYNYNKVYAVINGKYVCGDQSLLMWSGSQSVVIRCALKGKPRKFTYLMMRDVNGVRFTSTLKEK